MLVSDAQLKPHGYQQIIDVSTAVGLTLPTGFNGRTGKVVVIVVEGEAVRWRDDGTNPTTSVGMPLAEGATFVYTGDPSTIKFIEQAGSATLNVSYYQATGV